MYGTAKGSMKKTPGKSTFVTGNMPAGKVALGGKVNKGGDLRGKKGSNAGKMPKTV